jgi:hypothetical protein
MLLVRCSNFGKCCEGTLMELSKEGIKKLEKNSLPNYQLTAE